MQGKETAWRQGARGCLFGEGQNRSWDQLQCLPSRAPTCAATPPHPHVPVTADLCGAQGQAHSAAGVAQVPESGSRGQAGGSVRGAAQHRWLPLHPPRTCACSHACACAHPAHVPLPPLPHRGQLLWREFFTLCGAAIPNFDRMQGNPGCKQVGGRAGGGVVAGCTGVGRQRKRGAVTAGQQRLAQPGGRGAPWRPPTPIHSPPAACAYTLSLACPPPPPPHAQIPWVDDPERLQAWQDSRTGYPWCAGWGWAGRGSQQRQPGGKDRALQARLAAPAHLASVQPLWLHAAAAVTAAADHALWSLVRLAPIACLQD